MAETKVARRYARSLLDIGKERNITDALYNDMTLLAHTVKSNRQLAAMLKSPVIHTFKKDTVLKQIFTGKVNEASLEFMLLVTSKSRENYLDDIAKSFIELYKNFKNIQPANVVTAMPLDEKLRNEMLNILKRATGSSIELKETIDPSILGGFILRWGDSQYDASVTSRLNALKQDFRKSFINK